MAASFPSSLLYDASIKLKCPRFASHPGTPTVNNNRVYYPSPPPANHFFPLCTVTGRLQEDTCTVSIKSNHV